MDQVMAKLDIVEEGWEGKGRERRGRGREGKGSLDEEMPKNISREKKNIQNKD